MRALAAPSSLKGALTARAAARVLAEGFRRAGWECDEQPVADGGEGTLDALRGLVARRRKTHVPDAFGRRREAQWVVLRDGTAVVEAAQAIPFDANRRDVRNASSRGLAELIAEVEAPALVVALGGTANMDAGEGLLEVLDALPAPTRVACDVRTKLVDAPRLYGPQKGATPDDVRELEERFRALPYGDLPGSGAAGGLGGALASLGAELVPGGELVLDLVDFDPSPYDLVVTGEGTVDETTWEGKAPAVVVARCADAGVECVLFGGRVVDGDAVALPSGPERAYEDLLALATRLATRA